MPQSRHQIPRGGGGGGTAARGKGAVRRRLVLESPEGAPPPAGPGVSGLCPVICGKIRGSQDGISAHTELIRTSQ